MLKTMIKKLVLLFFIANAISCGFANKSIEGNYCKTDKSTMIYLKIKSINDSIYYFELKDYDTTKDNYRGRNIIGTMLYTKGNLRLINASFYLNEDYFNLSIKNNSRVICVEDNNFHMYYSFNDIKGNYIKLSDTTDLSYNEFQVPYNNRNSVYTAKQQIKVTLFDFPFTQSKSSNVVIMKNEKIYELNTMGSVFEKKPINWNNVSRFSLIDIPRLKIRKWINTDELEDKCK
jgi:hypothetical protein